MLAVLVATAGCAGTEPGSEAEPLSVWAAASTAAAVEDVARARVLPGAVPARVNPDATSRIAAQLRAGAPADVFVSADRRWMEWAVDRGVVDPASVRTVATNRLVLAGGSGAGPGAGARGGDGVRGPTTLAELLGPGSPLRTLAVAGEEVPAGRYGRQALASLDPAGASAGGPNSGPRRITGGSVRSVAEWAATGEVDAALIYASDLTLDPRLRLLATIPAEAHEPIEVLAAVVAASSRSSAAQAFVDAMVGEVGRSAFQAAGFAAAQEEVPGFEGRARGSDAATEAVSGQGAAPLLGTSSPPAGVSVTSAVWISLRVALLATLLSLVPAVLLGWLMARRDFPGKSLLNAVLLAPMVIPPVVTGFLLLWLVGSTGPLAGILAGAGVTLPFSFAAAVLAAGVVGFPLFVITVRNAFETVDPGLEEMARTLGSTPFQAFRRVTLPLARSGIAAGMILAFARALGEFGATVVLAGNLEGETRTIALAVYTLLEAPAGQRQVWVLVGASVGISFLALVGFEALSRRQRGLMRRGGHV